MKQATLNFKTILTVVLSSFLMLMCSNDERAITETEEDMTSSAIVQGTQSSASNSSKSGTSSTIDAEGREVIEVQVSVTENKGFNLSSDCDSIPYVVKVTCEFGFPEFGLSGADANNITAYVAGTVGSTSSIMLYTGDQCYAEVPEESISLCAGSLANKELTVGDSNNKKLADDIILSFSFSVTAEGEKKDISQSVSDAIKLNVTKDVSSSVSGTLAPDHVISGALTATPGWDKCGVQSGDDKSDDDGCITLELRLRSDSGMSASVESAGSLSCAEVKACKGDRACQISRQDGKFIPALELKPGDIHCFLHDQSIEEVFGGGTADQTFTVKLKNGESKSTYTFEVPSESLE
jgi:hypothetical protein